ncbi:hypothetical protein HYS92_00155 [Candidatus Daviesbacteria bacterium]|nr:hypothetical protein [Candidatus Daviesbacteria bacterium]
MKNIIWGILVLLLLIVLFNQLIRLGDVSIKEKEVEKQLAESRSNYIQLLDKYCKGKDCKIENGALVCKLLEEK